MKVEEKKIEEIVEVVRQTGFEVHVYFKNGFLEKIYENSLVNRLKKKGLNVKQQVPLTVYDEDGSIVGDYYADLLVEDQLIVELKAVQALNNNHMAQVLSYLKTSNLKHGMLMNFGAPKYQVQKLIL